MTAATLHVVHLLSDAQACLGLGLLEESEYLVAQALEQIRLLSTEGDVEDDSTEEWLPATA